jgi:glucose-1-phosphate thymidylyltransferase
MRASSGSNLDAATAAVADTGVKALIPIGRPFLDHVLHDLADAGITQVVLVIGPEHDEVRRYYSTLTMMRLSITFAVQAKPRGTADAVAAAQAAVGSTPFLVINSDNLYPSSALRPLATVATPGLVGFHRSGLLKGNIAADRVAKFAVIAANKHGELDRIIEKPSNEQIAALGDDPLLSMNCWAFDQSIFKACATISPSPRGELELPDAVLESMRHGTRYRIVKRDEAVLDLSSRDDVAAVRSALADHTISL